MQTTEIPVFFTISIFTTSHFEQLLFISFIKKIISSKFTTYLLQHDVHVIIFPIWIGIHDKTTEGQFEYESDSKKITFANWADKKPDNVDSCSGGEDCVSALEDGKWEDSNAEEEMHFVCEANCHEGKLLNC